MINSRVRLVNDHISYYFFDEIVNKENKDIFS